MFSHRRLELGLTDAERRTRDTRRRERNCGLIICLLLVAAGLLIDFNK